MDILYLLIPLSVVLAFLIGYVFWWSLRSGMFDDLEGLARTGGEATRIEAGIGGADLGHARLDRADRPKVHGRIEVHRKPGARTDDEGRVAQRRLLVTGGRAEARRLGRGVPQRDVVGDGDRREAA
jgi:cbb3-type cytochrome oxidase maturation protein